MTPRGNSTAQQKAQAQEFTDLFGAIDDANLTPLESLEAKAAHAPGAKTDGKGRVLIEILGHIETHREFKNNFVIATIETEVGTRRECITAKGTMSLTGGCVYRFTGVRDVHPTYGESYLVQSYEIARPADLEGIRRYLCSGIFPELGAKRATWLVDSLGASTLDVLDGPKDAALAALATIRGVTPNKAEAILDAYKANRKDSDVLSKLYQAGLTPYQAGKVTEQYGQNALSVLQNDPYRMAYDITGFGFLTVDGIAQRSGMAANDPRRNRAGVVHVLDEAAEGEGHTWLPMADLVGKAVKSLKLHEDDVRDAIQYLLSPSPATQFAAGTGAANTPAAAPPLLVVEGRQYRDCDAVSGIARTTLHQHEAIIGAVLMEAATIEQGPMGATITRGTLAGYNLTPEQESGVIALFSARIGVLTGGPGVGKTYTLKALLGQWERRGDRVMLCSPTGKAAIRMQEATGREASTIHRLLGYGPFGFTFNIGNPLPGGHIVVDEASMVDVPLMSALCSAIDFSKTTLTLVGDVDQLPSVGAGSVLRDVIDSKVFPVIWLTRIMRQAEGSTIIRNAHRIIHGDTPESDNAQFPDWQWFDFGDVAGADEVSDELIAAVTQWLPSKGFDPIRDVQILTPMRKLALGVDALNMRLQSILNPKEDGKPEVIVGGGKTQFTLRVGDKVMQMRNNYKLGVFNGEVGFIVRVDVLGEGVVVDFGREVPTKYATKQEYHDLALAYATTIHKSQGSEFPVVVIPVHAQHWIMLGRQLLYTAVTRAKEAVLLFGQPKALKQAVKNADHAERYTLLRGMLADGVNSEG